MMAKFVYNVFVLKNSTNKCGDCKMSNKVKIHHGVLRNGTKVTNIVLPVVTPIKERSGPFFTNFEGVFDSRGIANIKNQKRITIFFSSSLHFEETEDEITFSDEYSSVINSSSSEDDNEDNNEEVNEKTDEEIRAELEEKFFILDLISQGVASNQIRSLVVTGSPGTGKSFGIEKVMREKEKENVSFFFTTLKGTVSAIKLYSQLWDCREKNCVLIIDDCDIDDVECFNMLKAATDSSRKRIISYNKLANFLAENDIPHSFEFEGGLIYLSNINLADELKRKSKIAPHVAAFVSRAHYIDVTLKTKREQIIRVMMVAESEGFAKEHNVTKKQIEMVCQWVHENAHKVREISIRLITKLCDLVKTFKEDWQRIANVTLCR